jgi:hypothetical protein
VLLCAWCCLLPPVAASAQTTTICDRTVPTIADQQGAVKSIVVSAVTTLLGMESQRPFFNGSINYRYAADPFAVPVNVNSRLGTPNGAGSIAAPDYTVAGTEQNALIAKLTDFFGAALGCTAYTQAPATPPNWTKVGFNSDMEAIHRGMPISTTIMTEFINAVGGAAAGAGMAQADVTTVAAVLGSFSRGSFTTAGNIPTNAASGLDYAPNKAIQNIAGKSPCVGDNAFNAVNQQCTAAVSATRAADQTICQYYSGALFGGYANDAVNQYNLVKAVVTRAVLGDATTTPVVPGLIKAASPTLTFFDGTTNSRANGGSVNNDHPTGTGNTSPNYLTNGPALNYLVDHLISFFGSALGCKAYAFPAYTGVTSMKAVHAGMKIDATIFNYFNEQVALSAKSYGVTDADVATVGSVLASFGRATAADGTQNDASICNQDGCPCQTGYSGNTCTVDGTDGGAASSIQAFSFAAILAVLLAMVARA